MRRKRATTDGETSGDGSDALPPLPSGWCWTTVSQLLIEPTCNGISIKGADSPPGVPALRLSAMTDAGFDYRQCRYIPISQEVAERLSVRRGDFFVSRGNGSLHLLGRPTLAQDPPYLIVFPDTMIRLRFADQEPLPNYINYLWGSRILRSQVESKARTTAGIYKISQRDVESFLVPIPPRQAQQRIVARLDQLLSDLDAGLAILERLRIKLKLYRASVLKAAVEGRLTEEWRESHPDVEPGSALLDRILAERRRRWEEEELTKFAKARKQPPKGWQSKYREPDAADIRDLPPLPQGWCWATLDAISYIEGGITKDQKRSRTATMREVPYLRVANVQRGFFDLREVKSILADEVEIDSLRLKRGDILFTEGGDRDKLGRGCVWAGEIEECIHQNHIFRARPLVPDSEPKFISYHGNSFGREWFTRTGNRPQTWPPSIRAS